MKKICLFIVTFIFGVGLAKADVDVWISTNIRTNVTNFVITPSTYNGYGIIHSVSISSACAGGSYMILYDSRNGVSGTPARSQQVTIGPIGGGTQFQYFYDISVSSGITVTTSGLPNTPIGCGFEVQYKTPIR